ncbi:hypothetical protein TSEDIMI_170053 [Tenacibaculum sediminilitoris]
MISNFETLTSISQDVAAGTINYVDEGGATTTLDIAALIAQHETLTSASFDATTGVLTYNDEDGTANAIDLSGMISNFETLTSISQDVAAGTINYVDEEGITTTLDIAALIAQHETLTSMVQDDTTGAITYTDEDGGISTAEIVSADANNLVQVGVDGGSFIDATTFTEPWFDQATDTEATLNTQNIYQMGNVAVQKIDNLAGTSLDVEGVVHGGTGHTGTVGANSAVFGENNQATGVNSFAAGFGNIASGNNAVALGSGAGFAAGGAFSNNEAAGAYSFVMGHANKLWGTGSAVFGNGNQVGTSSNQGNWSFVAGLRNATNSGRAFIFGMDNVVNNTPNGLYEDYLFGARNTANGAGNYLIGNDLQTTSGFQVAIGQYNAIQTTGNPRPADDQPALTEPVFQIGVGSTANLKNAITVLYNSYTGIGITGTEATAIPTEMLDIGSNGVKIRDINTAAYTGNTATDNVVVADANGVLKTVAAAGLSSVSEPWFDQVTGTQATSNTQNIYQTGKVGVLTNNMLGTTDSNVVLAINGAMLTTTSIYADYVFEDYFEGTSKLNKAYSFKLLSEVEDFINKNRHLPGITKIDALSKNEKGDYVINPTELSVQVLEKVEELYLHTIEQQKLLDKKDKKIQELETRLERLETLLLKEN